MLIKKYKNRRLYNTETSQYITLDDVESYIIEGKSFKVVDSITDKDITSVILLQIIVEQQSLENPLLSQDVLRQLIILAKHPMSQSFKTILDQFFSRLKNPLDDWQKQWGEALSKWQSLFKP